MYLWTSEAVAAGHPDKVADQIADAVLDAYLAVDPLSRVACEVTLTTDPETNRGLVLVTGEITSDAKPNIEGIVRSVLSDIGYDRDENSFNCDTVDILNKIKKQSPIIAQAVTRDGTELGAGDQGIMFGYATNETSNFMPLPHAIAFEAIRLIEADIEVGRQGEDWLSPFLPDAKAQATILFNEVGRAIAVDSVLISACHRSDVSLADLKFYVEDRVIKHIKNGQSGHLINDQTKWIINPAGEWSFGGPAADTGLSGRKIVVDNYGADCPVGGGSFSGKDPTKVDRSGAYAARHLAKNIVAAKFCNKCQVQIAYAIGVVEPVSVRIQILADDSPVKNTQEDYLSNFIQKNVSLSPKGIIDRFQLRRPIYRQTASGGHFGNPSFPWEQLDLDLGVK